MVNQNVLKKYAQLVVKTGVNVQKNQPVTINCSVSDYEFARLVVDACYEAGASQVFVEYSDSVVSKSHFMNQSLEDLCIIPDYVVAKEKYRIELGVAKINLSSPNPMAFAGVDPKKMQAAAKASSEKLEFVRDYTMNSKGQWSVIAIPNAIWAKKVFPNLSEEEGMKKLWEAILTASRVSEDNDPTAEWKKHIENLEKYNEKLDKFNFKQLHFKNSLGTDIVVELAKNHIWAGGSEYRPDGVMFAPNIPTEEVFTMPNKTGVNGTVVSTKPLSYQGKIIEDFKLTFKNGKVVEFEAKSGYDSLKSLIEFDEGSSYLGEVALISNDSPISNMNILFYNTLFDENASCHFALGRAYAINVKNGTNMSKEELIAAGANMSNTHVDFMFGSPCMNIIGLTQDNKEIEIFKNGNFVF